MHMHVGLAFALCAGPGYVKARNIHIQECQTTSDAAGGCPERIQQAVSSSSDGTATDTATQEMDLTQSTGAAPVSSVSSAISAGVTRAPESDASAKYESQRAELFAPPKQSNQTDSSSNPLAGGSSTRSTSRTAARYAGQQVVDLQLPCLLSLGAHSGCS